MAFRFRRIVSRARRQKQRANTLRTQRADDLSLQCFPTTLRLYSTHRAQPARPRAFSAGTARIVSHLPGTVKHSISGPDFDSRKRAHYPSKRSFVKSSYPSPAARRCACPSRPTILRRNGFGRGCRICRSPRSSRFLHVQKFGFHTFQVTYSFHT